MAPVARVGGSLLVGAVTVVAAVAVVAVVSRRFRAALAAAAAVAAALAPAAVAPDGVGTGRWLAVDVVQGGGPQGTHAVDADAADVVERHLAAPTGFSAVIDPEGRVSQRTGVS